MDSDKANASAIDSFPDIPNGKAVVILSGGIDSATILAKVVAEHGLHNVAALNFDYGSKHNAAERACARKLAAYYGLSKNQYREVDLPFIKDLFRSKLLQGQGDIPHGHYADDIMRDTVVPFRNGIMLSIAVGYAESISANIEAAVYIGNHAGDHPIYPDCRPEFISAIDWAARCGTYAEVSVASPFVNYTKADIVLEGTKLGVPYALTYSCYKGRESHCGKCGTCVERKEAFVLAGVTDPTKYESDMEVNA